MKPEHRLNTINSRLQESGKAWVILEVTGGVVECRITASGSGVPIVVIWDWDDCNSTEEVYKPRIVGHEHMPDGLLDFPESEAKLEPDDKLTKAMKLLTNVVHSSSAGKECNKITIPLSLADEISHFVYPSTEVPAP